VVRWLGRLMGGVVKGSRLQWGYVVGDGDRWLGIAFCL